MTLGGRIEARRKELGLSQAELARRAKVPQTTMNSLINSDSRWSPHLLKIARELRTTAAYLTGETDDPDADMPDETLSSEEAELVENFREMQRSEQLAILTLTRSGAAKARSPTIHEKGLAYRAEEVGA